MKTLQFIKREMLFFAILLLPVVYMLLVWNRLPAQVPIHWNVYGQIDNYGSRYWLFVFTGGIYLLLLFAPKLDTKRKANYEKFEKTFFLFRLFFQLFFCVICCLIITAALGVTIRIEHYIVPGLSMLFTVLGNYMNRIKQNSFVGIRTPWTLSNETIWHKTHYITGKLWFWLGLAMIFLSFIINGIALFVVFMAYLLILTAIPFAYSYYLAKRKAIN